jgi:hypothetical protein
VASKTVEAAIGVATHSAWAMLVAVCGPQEAPGFLQRKRIEIAGNGLPSQAYHAAADAGLTMVDAADLVDRCAAAATKAAETELSDLVAELRRTGHQVVACGIAANVKHLPPLPDILRSHPLLHTAEGELARAAIAGAATRLHLRVVHVPPKNIPPPKVASIIADLGRAAGTPWAADQKTAASAALAALSPSG